MRFLVAGSINVETSVPVEGFPLAYTPVRYTPGIGSAVSGVGWNVARALHTLGSEVVFLGLVGRDPAGAAVREEVARSGITAVLEDTAATPQSVILYDPAGRRRAETDLKGLQEATFPATGFDAALARCDRAVLANVNWTRPLLARAAAAGVPVATDLHDVRSLDNPYDADYLDHAAVLFLSGEHLPEDPAAFARRLRRRTDPEVIGIGLGARGALVAPRGADPVLVPAPALRAVVSTIGAGDALFAGFLHFYDRRRNPLEAMRRAVAFAAWKVGEAAGSAGFLSEDQVEALLG
ncbi:MAG: carbohydrate kinase family protein [Acidimicrobiia bacterium]|nr:carbohydrate kinase family protein [Acidimicrobiia bacterium]